MMMKKAKQRKKKHKNKTKEMCAPSVRVCVLESKR